MKEDSQLPVKRKQGFTLIEVMIALFVFGVGILAVSKMALEGFSSFDRARSETTEVNRGIKNIDTLNRTLYTNTQVFSANSQGPCNFPLGSYDQPIISSWDFDDVVVDGTKFIAIENNDIRGPSISGNYRLYVVKPDRPRVN